MQARNGRCADHAAGFDVTRPVQTADDAAVAEISSTCEERLCKGGFKLCKHQRPRPTYRCVSRRIGIACTQGFRRRDARGLMRVCDKGPCAMMKVFWRSRGVSRRSGDACEERFGLWQ